MDGSFIGEDLRETRSDRLYRLRLLSGATAYVYCLIEHKSAPDPRVGLQFLGYLVHIWERLDKEAGGKGPLPPVIPLVVYHGAVRWKTPLRFTDMVAVADEIDPRHLLDFPIRVVDVGQIADADLSDDHQLRGGLMVLKYAMLVTAENQKEVVASVFAQVSDLPQGFVEMVVRSTVKAYRTVDRQVLSEALKRAMPGKEKHMVSIAAEEWLAEGEAKGRAEGKAEGEAKGKAETLAKILVKRFGPVSETYLERIAKARISELDDWLDRAIDAASIEAVFSPPAH